MINVIDKKCLEEKCNKIPLYNFSDKKTPIYCLTHKKDNMINVKDRQCLEENCNKRPIYNFQNKKTGIYCKEHKKENMIDVKNKRCLEENCNKQPNFNLQNEDNPIYCKDHKKINMIDIKHKKCLEENCNKIPSFNLLNEKTGIYCKEHSKENMIDVINKKCSQENCEKQSRFNFENKKDGLYCFEHKKDNMVNVKDKRCKECNETQISNKQYKGYCLRCFVYKFPDVKISRNYKVKEIHMTDFIKQEFKTEVMTFDKQTGGCSKRRPDVYIDKFTHVVIVECDENQHKDTSCENKRTMELFQDFGNRPIVFIRFNPDSYVNQKNKKIPSSFKMHKTLDVPVIRNPKEWEGRLNVLKETISHWLKEIPKKEITYEYLFYDFN